MIEGKINCINCMENVLKGMKLLRVSGRFELEGSSYREMTVLRRFISLLLASSHSTVVCVATVEISKESII